MVEFLSFLILVTLVCFAVVLQRHIFVLSFRSGNGFGQRKDKKIFNIRKFIYLGILIFLLILSFSLQIVAAQFEGVTADIGKHIWSSALITMALTILAVGIMMKTTKKSNNELIDRMDVRHSKTIEDIAR